MFAREAASYNHAMRRFFCHHGLSFVEHGAAPTPRSRPTRACQYCGEPMVVEGSKRVLVHDACRVRNRERIVADLAAGLSDRNRPCRYCHTRLRAGDYCNESCRQAHEQAGQRNRARVDGSRESRDDRPAAGQPGGPRVVARTVQQEA